MEDCSNGDDDDADGLVDCEDDECYGRTDCEGFYTVTMETDIDLLTWRYGSAIYDSIGERVLGYINADLKVTPKYSRTAYRPSTA